MAVVNIIGSGHMASGLAVRLIEGRNQVQILGRNDGQMRNRVEFLGPAARGAYVGSPLEGNTVIRAVSNSATREVITEYGDGLEGKVVVDIGNPVDFSTMDRLTTPPGSSAAGETAEVLAGRADVVRAFNTRFAKTLATGQVAGQRLHVLIAGDSEPGKAKVSALAAPSGMRPIDTGPLRHAREPEAVVLLVMGLQVDPEDGSFNRDTALKILPWLPALPPPLVARPGQLATRTIRGSRRPGRIRQAEVPPPGWRN
jgi:8-hydroxy-5-deazaflavin:NADPH oxidoreductase